LEALFDFGTKKCLKSGYERFRLKTASESVIEAAKEAGFSYSEHHRCTPVHEYEKTEG